MVKVQCPIMNVVSVLAISNLLAVTSALPMLNDNNNELEQTLFPRGGGGWPTLPTWLGGKKGKSKKTVAPPSSSSSSSPPSSSSSSGQQSPANIEDHHHHSPSQSTTGIRFGNMNIRGPIDIQGSGVRIGETFVGGVPQQGQNKGTSTSSSAVQHPGIRFGNTNILGPVQVEGSNVRIGGTSIGSEPHFGKGKADVHIGGNGSRKESQKSQRVQHPSQSRPGIQIGNTNILGPVKIGGSNTRIGGTSIGSGFDFGNTNAQIGGTTIRGAVTINGVEHFPARPGQPAYHNPGIRLGSSTHTSQDRRHQGHQSHQSHQGGGSSSASTHAGHHEARQRAPTWSQKLAPGTTTELKDDHGNKIDALRGNVKVTKTDAGTIHYEGPIVIDSSKGSGSIEFGNTHYG